MRTPEEIEKLKQKYIEECSITDSYVSNKMFFQLNPIEMWEWIKANCLNVQEEKADKLICPFCNTYLPDRFLQMALNQKEGKDNEWISVSDKLPERSLYVLTYYKSDINGWVINYEVLVDSLGFRRGIVSHWKKVTPPNKL